MLFPFFYYSSLSPIGKRWKNFLVSCRKAKKFCYHENDGK